MVMRDHPALSLSRQCRLLSIGRSSLYYTPKGESPETLALMRRIDALFLKYPFYGARQMVRHLRREGVRIGRRRASRLLRLMGLQAVYRAPRTSAPRPEHRLYPYLLKALAIERANHVWCADITYIPVRRGFLYLVAAMDWASRYVLAWRLSNTLDASFCVEALEEALARHGTPEIFNTDQGQPVHRLRLHRAPADGRRPDLDGRQGPVPGQHLHRAAVAFAQIRGRLSARARRRLRGAVQSSANGSASTTPRGRTRRSAGGRRPRPTAAMRLWIWWTSRYAPCPHPHRRNSNGKEIDSKAFWRHERQTEYTLTGSPDCPKKRSHLSPGNQ